MRLYLSDSSFEVGGQSYEGFPILVDSKGHIVEVALRFFVDYLIGRVGAQDLKTWEAYGRHLYDYFGYLEPRNNLSWDQIPAEGSGDVSSLAHYVHWCKKSVGNKGRYINEKRATVERFYTWALQVGLVTEMPSMRIDIRAHKNRSILSHTSAKGGVQKVSSLSLPEPDEPLLVLTRGQIETVLSGVNNPTHRAVLYLGLNTGLRAEELVSFPKKYVVDCSKFSSKVKTVSVNLDPADMNIKNNKRRTVRVSVGCMNILWQYREGIRPRLQRLAPDSNHLFLNRFGNPFADDGLVTPLARLGRRIGFHIHPHMLRHTFATHTLSSLQDLKSAGKIRSSPLIILKNLLGHSSITTTSRYVDHLDAIDDSYGTKYQAEIDALVLGYLDAK